ncbi:MAG: nucleoside triphosphate pyrophosphohydrolase [Pseudomonadota bacterium]
MNKSIHSARYTLTDLLRIMERLRDPTDGCPWDIKQDFQSLIPSTIEECYELAAAIEELDYDHIADELGDVLFQVIFYSQLGREQESFDFHSVVDGLAQKLLRRHPHVFADGAIEGRLEQLIDSRQVKEQWESIKASERQERAQLSALDDVPTALPALPRAQKLQKRAARVNFDWDSVDPVFDKVLEEFSELKEAHAEKDSAAVEEELGDLLFTVVNLARHLGIDAEMALRGSNRKFERRFRAVEATAASSSVDLERLDAAALEELWELSKQAEVSPKARP